MLAAEDGEMVAQSRKIHIDVDAVGGDRTLSGAAGQSIVHAAEWDPSVHANTGDRSMNVHERAKVSETAPSEGINELVPIEVDSNASLVSTLISNAITSVSVRQLSRER